MPLSRHARLFRFSERMISLYLAAMFSVLGNPTYARLLAAQIIALLGTGLLTVALGLLAFDLAGERAGLVLGTALAIKMVAYVALAPVVSALTAGWPRKLVLVGADVVRAAAALALPFLDAVWQVYVLIFVLQAASATFTPTFQALIPDVLRDEQDYTKALSLSRLAYDLESLLSPALAGFLLLVMSYSGLFVGTVIGFAVSAALVLTTVIPPREVDHKARRFVERLTRGVRIYLATPRLRGLLSLNLAASAAGAFVIVNTVVVVRAGYGLSEGAVALALAAFGGGSMLSALAMPRLLDKVADRSVMICAAVGLAVLTIAHGIAMLWAGLVPWSSFLLVWAMSGALFAAIMLPAGRLLRRSAHEADRTAVFAAQFALSHACWLMTYPLAGWLGEAAGLPDTMLVLGLIAGVGVAIAWRIWPVDDPAMIEHDHPDLPSDHPHLRAHHGVGRRHRHAFIIDDEHRIWPSQG